MPLALATSSGELTALSDLFYACDGDNWLDNSNWLVGDPCENSTFSWYGVSCENNHVVGLYLNDNGLDGTLPTSLTNLYEADTFSLFNNEISGPIPDNWNNVKTLVKIDLHGNVLSSSIPDSLGELLDYNLNYLDLSDNKLTGAIPSFFDGAEEEFQYVDLSGNRFVCPIPSWATYTDASCIQLTLQTTQPLCVSDGLSYMVFGSNFFGLEDLKCTLADIETGEVVSSTPATVVSDSVIQCIAKYPFQSCDGMDGGNLYALSQLSLTYEGQVVTSNSTVVSLGVTNPLCPIGSSTTITGSNNVVWELPSSTESLLAVCEAATTTTPWSCPASVPRGSASANVKVEFDANCVNSANTTCLWTPANGKNCPFFQCYSGSCHYTGCQSSTYYGATCYTNSPDCADTC